MRQQIAQIVDSAGSIPREILKRYGIGEVAFRISFDDSQHFQENVNITSEEFYLRLKERPDRIPKTSIPSVAQWTLAFEEKYRDGYREMIITTISRLLSASVQSATVAASAFMSSHSDAHLQIVESNTCACGQAALEIKIARLIEQGQLMSDELVKWIHNVIPGVVSLFSVNELTYMKNGGRIGGAAAFLGKLISIKPVCEFVGGVVHPVKAVRYRKKALLSLVDEAVKRCQHLDDAVICVQHALCEEDAGFLIEQLRERLGDAGPIYQGAVGAVVGAHSGPGAIGIGIA